MYDDPNNPKRTSAMRVMCMMSLIASIVFGYLTLSTGNSTGLEITVAFLVGAFAPKAVQKFAEKQI